MICAHCQKEIAENSRYCYFCGSYQGADPSSSAKPKKRLTLSAKDKKIAGVCGGIAEYLDVDSAVVRLIWALLSIFPGSIIGGIVAYLIAWFILPAPPAAAVVRAPERSTSQEAHTT